MIQTFSQKLSAHLSSLVPGFEKHYGYYKFYDDSISVACYEEIWWIEKHREFTQVRRKKPDLICPAWQVEDLLKNLQKICSSAKIEPAKMNELIEEITSRLILLPDTAYQKIEEYLWSILK